jgi:hypothetical protein
MAVKSKTALGRVEFQSRAKYKHTHQGNGTRSLPKRGKKLRRGQGK